MARRLGPKDPFKLVWDRGELNRLLSSEDGPVALDLAVRAQRVAASAKRRAPRRTGALKRSIRFRMGTDEQGVYADVFSDEFYAMFVEKGHRKPEGKGYVSPRRFLRPALSSGRRGRRN